MRVEDVCTFFSDTGVKKGNKKQPVMLLISVCK